MHFLIWRDGMRELAIIDYEKLKEINLKRSLTRKNLNKHLRESLEKDKTDSVIMLEVPAENYFEKNTESIRFLLENGFDGLYISFQRPFRNVF